MKRFLYTGLVLLFISAAVYAQNANQSGARVSRGDDRQNRQAPTENPAGQAGLSVRAQILNEQLTRDVGNARWMRIILRELDLTKEKNSPLYYPLQELNGSFNLFMTLFQLLSEGKIKVYEYLPDNDALDESNVLSYKDLLKKFEIFYDSIPINGPAIAYRYIVNASDIPSQEVKALYVKEAWYFDQHNSLYDVKTIALCPIAYMNFNMGDDQRMPMFWVKYEDVQPYIKNTYIMTSNLNNARTFTFDDYFRRRMFDGEIVKTENLMNLALMEYCPTPDSLKMEQERIENQLLSFNETLWIKPDTTVVLTKKEAKKASSSRSSSSTPAASKEKAPKQPKAPPAEKATKSAPTRSIRR